MSKNNGKNQMQPSAPPSFEEIKHQQKGPPSYDECLKAIGVAAIAPHQYTYSNPSAYQQQQAFQPLPSYQMPPQLVNFAAPGPLSSYGYANPYQTHIQLQQSYLNTPPIQSPHLTISKPAENVLYLAKGAKIKTTTSGAISIPPPPPGCCPTPAQLAAMSGKPVIVKKQKKSFF